MIIPAADARLAPHTSYAPPQAAPCPPQQGIQISGMVAHFRRTVEWNFFSRTPGTSLDSAAGVRHLRHMGLWCVAWLPLVSGAVGPASGCAADNSEGADPHCTCLRGLGATMAQA